MPTPSRAHRLSRRAVLGGLAAVAALPLAGCTETPAREDHPGPVEPEVDPDVTIAAEALAAQQAVIALITATRQRHPGLGTRLAPMLAAHEAHAGLLAEAVPEGAAPQGETSTADPASPTPAPTTVPANARRALRAVVTRERELVTVTKQHAFKARSGAFARVLGSMAAAAAQHAAVLGAPGGAS